MGIGMAPFEQTKYDPQSGADQCQSGGLRRGSNADVPPNPGSFSRTILTRKSTKSWSAELAKLA